MSVRLILGDVREKLAELPDDSVHCVVTSPPYFGLRDYGVAGQIGLEPTPAEFVAVMVEVFREVRRVLRKDGTCWINLGDSYNANQGLGFNGNAGKPTSSPRVSSGGLPPKNLLGIPWRVAFALQADGWYLRQDIIWSKPNPMPESVTDRCTKAHEYLFLLSKSARYHYDAEAVAEAISDSTIERWGTESPERKNPSTQGLKVGATSGESCFGTSNGKRNRRSVWTVATQPFKEAHFATFPPDLIEPCIKAGCPKDCCAKCGAPVVREFTKELVPTAKAAKTFVVDERDQWADANDQGSNRQKDGHKPGWINRVETTGWLPSCSCDAGLARGTVLDPFGGAGTTGLVADRLQRDAILIELNPEYETMARARIADDAGPLFPTVVA